MRSTISPNNPDPAAAELARARRLRLLARRTGDPQMMIEARAAMVRAVAAFQARHGARVVAPQIGGGAP